MHAVLLLTLVASTLAGPAWWDRSRIVPLDLLPPKSDVPTVDVKDVTGGARIVGGQEATPHSFPYQVALFIPVQGGRVFCGGSLIADEWVLTAAHCFEYTMTGPVKVVLGAQHIDSTESTQVIVNSSAVYTHPSWNKTRHANDVSLIKLSEKIEKSTYIQTIRLPSQSEQQTTFASLEGTVSGWGRVSDDAQTVSPVLRYVKVPVMKNFDCNLILQEITDSQVCTSGTDKKGACYGDSGGPLVIEETDGIRTQIGIVSFGRNLCQMGWPDVYTRVSSYLNWIASTANITIRS